MKVQVLQKHIDTGNKGFVENPIAKAIKDREFCVISVGPDLLFVGNPEGLTRLYISSEETAEVIGRHMFNTGVMQPFTAVFKMATQEDLDKRQFIRNPTEKMNTDFSKRKVKEISRGA